MAARQASGRVEHLFRKPSGARARWGIDARRRVAGSAPRARRCLWLPRPERFPRCPRHSSSMTSLRPASDSASSFRRTRRSRCSPPCGVSRRRAGCSRSRPPTSSSSMSSCRGARGSSSSPSSPIERTSVSSPPILNTPSPRSRSVPSITSSSRSTGCVWAWPWGVCCGRSGWRSCCPRRARPPSRRHRPNGARRGSRRSSSRFAVGKKRSSVVMTSSGSRGSANIRESASRGNESPRSWGAASRNGWRSCRQTWSPGSAARRSSASPGSRW